MTRKVLRSESQSLSCTNDKQAMVVFFYISQFSLRSVSYYKCTARSQFHRVDLRSQSEVNFSCLSHK